ncbi:MAG TPA: FecR family protein, partial [Puia sp.]|nr:FecR family protein [Puia sp.]
MDNLEDHLKQFWENQTTPSQRREILRRLEESGMEWKDFLQQYYNKVLAGEVPHGLDDARKSRVWQRLRDQHLGQGAADQVADGRQRRDTGQSDDRQDGESLQKPNGRVAWYRWMAAASIMLIAGLCIHWWVRTPSAQSPTVRQTAAVKVIVKKNMGTGEEHLTLPDNSLVVLAPGSSIRYLERFETRARNIQLEGRALFEVAKDSARPFTVTARGFATTALGTRFIVDATRPHISIRLLKGKVVVNTTPD